MVITLKNEILKSEINVISNKKNYEYTFNFNNRHMKNSSQINWNYLPLCDLIRFRPKNSTKGKPPSCTAEAKGSFGH